MKALHNTLGFIEGYLDITLIEVLKYDDDGFLYMNARCVIIQYKAYPSSY